MSFGFRLLGRKYRERPNPDTLRNEVTAEKKLKYFKRAYIYF